MNGGHTNVMPRLLLLFAGLLVAAPILASGLLDEARAAVEAQRFEVAEQLLRRQLRARPADEQARFLLARVLAWQKKRASALVEFDALLKANPRDADYFLGKAQTLVWDGRPDEALPLLERARTLSPQYEAVWRLQISALIALGDEYHLRQARTVRAMAAGRFPHSEWRFAALDPAAVEPEAAREAGRTATARQAGSVARRRPAELELGFTNESLSRGFAPWRSVYLDGMYRFDPRHVAYGSLRGVERASLTDSQAEAGLYYPLGDKWTSLVQVNVSPSHRVLPRYSLLGQLQRDLAYGWNLQAGVRHHVYSNFNTNTAVFTSERYWGNFRAAYSVALGRLEGDTATAVGHYASFDHYYGARSSIGVAVGLGREIADAIPGSALITDVQSFSLRGRHWISPAWAISYEVLYHEQGRLYARRGLRVGLRRAF